MCCWRGNETVLVAGEIWELCALKRGPLLVRLLLPSKRGRLLAFIPAAGPL